MENAHLGEGSPSTVRARPALRGGRSSRPRPPSPTSCHARKAPPAMSLMSGSRAIVRPRVESTRNESAPLEASLRSLRNVGADDYGRPHDSGGIRPRMEDARADRARHARRPAMRGEHAKRIRTPLEARGKSVPKPMTDRVMIRGGQSLVSGGSIYSKSKFFSKNLR